MNTLRYGAVGLIVLLGAAVLWMAANPHVGADYRAYFIDKTTDCWALPTTGAVPLNQTISFVGEEATAATRALRACGWLDAQETGTWSLGPESRLHLAPRGLIGDALIDFEIVPFIAKQQPKQTAIISADGTELARWTMTVGATQHATVRVPHAIAARDGGFVLSLRFPLAISPAELKINADRRRLSIRLYALTIRDAAP